MTIAEFFMMRPHGPNCWKGLGAFKDLVLLKNRDKINYWQACDLAWLHLQIRRLPFWNRSLKHMNLSFLCFSLFLWSISRKNPQSFFKKIQDIMETLVSIIFPSKTLISFFGFLFRKWFQKLIQLVNNNFDYGKLPTNFEGCWRNLDFLNFTHKNQNYKK